MKIGRRCFLSFLIGGAAGTALTPLPWKLTDDLSIWTQTWPWTPVPPDGEINYVNSTCMLCSGGCGITVRKIDDRAVKIEGMKDHPVNNGGLCIMGLSGLQLLYGPRRVKEPMKRVGERGEGRWEKISWDAAIAELAQKLNTVRGSSPESVACITDESFGTVPQLFKRFMAAYGSPNLMVTPTIQDSYEQTLKLMQGGDGIPGFDLENSKFVLSFGCGILEGWGSSSRMFQAHSRWTETGGKLVQVEPRLSVTAAKADKWVSLNPGTEAVLALGIAQVIIKDGLYNKDFVEKHCAGFEDWEGEDGKKYKGFKNFVLEAFTPDTVARLTGVSGNMIQDLATNFAGAEKPIALAGRGKGYTPGSLHEFMAIHALNALVGNINQEGGVWTLDRPDYIRWGEPAQDPVAQKGNGTPRIDGAGTERYANTRSMVNTFAEAVNNGAAVEVLLVSGENPCYTLRGGEAVKKAFEKIPYIVSFSPYMDETAAGADLILPNHTYLERYQDVPAPFGLPIPIIGMTRPVVKPECDTKHVGDTLILTAKKMGGSVGDAFGWDDYESCLKETLGDLWGTLESDGFLVNADYRPPAWERAFGNESKKFQFFNESYAHGNNKDIFSQLRIEGDPGAFPLILVPAESMRIASGPVADTPFVMKTIPDDVLKDKEIFVEVNPATAAAYGLRDGKSAALSTPAGRARVRVNLCEGIRPGMVAMPTGLGRSANSRYIANKGVNFNDLIRPVPDPISGLDSAWGIRAKLERA